MKTWSLSHINLGMHRKNFVVVFLMGVLYDCRHTVLALYLVFEHAAHYTIGFQSMERDSTEVIAVNGEYALSQSDIFNVPDTERSILSKQRFFRPLSRLLGTETPSLSRPCFTHLTFAVTAFSRLGNVPLQSGLTCPYKNQAD